MTGALEVEYDGEHNRSVHVPLPLLLGGDADVGPSRENLSRDVTYLLDN